MRRLLALSSAATLLSACSATSPTGPQQSAVPPSRSEAAVEEVALRVEEGQAAGRPTQFPGCNTPAVYHVPDEVLFRFGAKCAETPPK